MSTLPLSVRRAIEWISLYFVGCFIVAAKDIISPLVMAFFFAMMLLPTERYLHKKGVPKLLSIGLPLLLFLCLLLLIVWFFSGQITALVNDFPQIKQNLQSHLHTFSKWIDAKTGFSVDSQAALINEQTDKLLNYSGYLIRRAATSFTNLIVFIALVPVYVFLILFYKQLLMRFLLLWFAPDHSEKVYRVAKETEAIMKRYLGGLLIQITYLVILLGGILFLLGIKHAILIGAIFALLNLIPYIGALFSNIIAVLLTLTSTGELLPVIIVLTTIAVVQFLDNNILMPLIVGGKVKINALVTLIGVIAGGALAGIAGMFLSLPVIAVAKIIFQNTPGMGQWAVLFSDDTPSKSMIVKAVTGKNRKRTKV